MLFSVVPKEKRKDLFNYTQEYNHLIKNIKDKKTPITVITGLRRTGKTSLMKVAYNQTRTKKIYLDARELGKNMNEVSRNILIELTKDDYLSRILGRISAVEISHFPVSLKIELTKNEKRLLDVLSQAGEITIFIDEVQKLKSIGFDNFISYVYDNLPNVKFILSGSEIGLLDKFLGRESSKTALYGRAIDIIHLHPLTEEKSVEFLERGFKEIGRKFEKEKLKEVVYRLDGIIGWLTMFGWFVSKKNTVDRATNNVLIEGGKLVKKEFETFLSNRYQAKTRYTIVINI